MNHKLFLHFRNEKPASIILALLIIGLFIYFIPSKIFPISWDFRNNLWGPSYLLVHQMSPYHIQILFSSSNAIWMPVIIGLFFPIGYLPLQWASNIWLLFNLLSLFLLVSIIARTCHKTVVWILLTILALVVFPSSISHFILGQISLIICLLLLLLIKYRSQLKPVVSGLLLAVSFTKPQLIVIFLPVYLITYFREQGIKKLLQVVLYTLIWAILLCLPLFLIFPHWIPDFLHNLSINNTWFYPSLYSFLISTSRFHGTAIVLAVLYLLIGISISIFLSFKLNSFETLLWGLAITPLFSPIVWSWDFVLLYPMIAFMVFEKKSKMSSRVFYCGYGLCTILYLAMRITGFVNDQYTIWIPPFLILVLLISYILRRNTLTEIPSALNN